MRNVRYTNACPGPRHTTRRLAYVDSWIYLKLIQIYTSSTHALHTTHHLHHLHLRIHYMLARMCKHLSVQLRQTWLDPAPCRSSTRLGTCPSAAGHFGGRVGTPLDRHKEKHVTDTTLAHGRHGCMWAWADTPTAYTYRYIHLRIPYTHRHICVPMRRPTQTCLDVCRIPDKRKY